MKQQTVMREAYAETTDSGVGLLQRIIVLHYDFSISLVMNSPGLKAGAIHNTTTTRLKS